MNKIKVGITIGDINGIGLEIILKTLSNPKIAALCIPVIYGSTKIVSYHKNIVEVHDFPLQSLKSADRLNPDKINIVNCWQENVNITLGKVSETGGKYAYISLDRAVDDLRRGLIDALVTAPIHKKSMELANFPEKGHTEYLTKELGGKQSLMLMISEHLKVGLVSNHVPVKDIASNITKEKILSKLNVLNHSLKMDFGLERPTIAVLGLNPHAGDDGVIGKEEETIIRPAIIEAKKKGILAMGPFPADGFFGSNQYKKFDAILAMYHDQGLVPFKVLSFGSGVNFTAGLKGIRTSPDHGTAFDIAGQNLADPTSFRKAIFSAIDIARSRKEYTSLKENSMVRKSKDLHQEDEALPIDVEETKEA